MPVELSILQLPIRRKRDVALAQQRARRLAALAGLPWLDQTCFATATAEIAVNALQYARRGLAIFSVIERDDAQHLQLVVHDEGPGIPDVTGILEGESQAATGVGQGLQAARRLVDYFDIQTSEKGTDVTLTKALPSGQQPVTEQVTAEWRETLRREPSLSTAAEARRQEEQMARALGELREYQEGLEQIVEQRLQELQATRELQAYTQGRLDVLDTIVHNIGNTIQAVTAGMRTIADELKNNRLTRYLYDCVEAIKTHKDDLPDYIKNNPQGRKVAPLLIILADNLKKREAEMVERMNRVAESAEHIASIVRSQKALGRHATYRKAVNVKAAAERAVALVLQDSPLKAHIRVHIDCDDVSSEIYTQESRFQQMLINLIKNAVEAIDERMQGEEPGSESVGERGSEEARERGSEGAGERASSVIPKSEIRNPKSVYLPSLVIHAQVMSDVLILSVIDNGVGIEKENLPLLFEPRYTTKPFGTGLGLHSVANFVKESGGQIEAMSEGRNRGTTIRIVLPVGRSTNATQ